MKTQAIKQTKYTPPQIAAMWGISVDKVLVWIRSGELRAIDGSSSRSQRPRYLIDIDDLKDFERRRAVSPPPSPRRRSQQKDDHVIEFYK